MTTEAIPLTRRRKRRPPNKREQFAIIWCFEALFVLGALGWALGVAGLPPSPWNVLTAAFLSIVVPVTIFGLFVLWPIVLNYIRNGYEDDQ